MSIANVSGSMFTGLSSALEEAAGLNLVRWARSKPGREKERRDAWRRNLKELAVTYSKLAESVDEAKAVEAVVNVSLSEATEERERAIRLTASTLGISGFITRKLVEHLLGLSDEEITRRLEAIAAAAI